MTAATIELKNLTMHFSADEPLLANINLKIGKGESLVLIGPSGQGKSTLLKLMAGILKPVAGNVYVEGEDINKLPDRKRQKLMHRMGMLFQKNALFDSLTVSDNIAFPLREVTNTPENEIQHKVEYFLQAVGIAHAAQLFPEEISGGMQKRLGIARALALDPEIIFYDDPTAGLDPITSRKIIDLILELKVRNRSTVVAITNDMNRAYQMADRIGMVVDKMFIETGDKEKTLAHQDPRVHQFVRGELDGPLTEYDG